MSEHVDIPVLIYAAKSSPDPRESTVSQVDRCRDAIEREGTRVVVVDPFSEENVSGFRRSRGPQLEAAMRAACGAAMEYGEAELWVFHSSRLARGSGLRNQARSLLEIFTEARRAGVTLRSVEDDPFVTNQMLIGIAAEQAHKYSADLSAHVRRGKEQQLERGERLGGPVPDGYTYWVETDDKGRPTARVYALDHTREPIFRRMFELSLEGARGRAAAQR